MSSYHHIIIISSYQSYYNISYHNLSNHYWC